MALKKWMKKCQPLSLYIVLTLTMFYFLLQLVVCYITHALTLTIDSYLVLCNLIALFGCIITIKSNVNDNSSLNELTTSSNSDVSSKSRSSSSQCDIKTIPTNELYTAQSIHNLNKQKASERRLKNTFGWARIDILVMLVGCVMFASFCFSLIIEAFQTIFHISHKDEMHYPIPVFCVGAFGLVLNGFCYLLIGGYTFHHGSVLRITSAGVVILEDARATTTMGRHDKALKLRSHSSTNHLISAGIQEMFRDVIGSVFVMICSTVVYFANPETAKLADPIFAIISAVSLMTLSYPYMKESCLILLQTIPEHINIDSLCKQLMKEFPDIINVHDLHVWQFTKEKTFFTAHIIFLNPKVYATITENLTKFFHEQGISKVTIQPEFFKDVNCLELISSSDSSCLVKCVSPECYQHHCCDMYSPCEDIKSVLITKTTSKECFKPEPNSCETSTLEGNSVKCSNPPETNNQIADEQTVVQSTINVNLTNDNQEETLRLPEENSLEKLKCSEESIQEPSDVSNKETIVLSEKSTTQDSS